MLNLSRAQTLSHWWGAVVRKGGARSGVILVTYRGSKLRGPPPKALVYLNTATLIFTPLLTEESVQMQNGFITTLSSAETKLWILILTVKYRYVESVQNIKKKLPKCA
ncbi:hypothetical protein TNCV_771531 [Trichonephila clavipes]|nr:hypothetical protein TNCV_771531 [Trichonephila clavipes]